MTLQLRRAQRRRIIMGSLLTGILVACAAFFAVKGLQTASSPPDESAAGSTTEQATANPTPVPTPPASAEASSAEPELIKSPDDPTTPKPTGATKSDQPVSAHETEKEAPKDKAPKDKAPKDKAPKDKAPKDKTPKQKRAEKKAAKKKAADRREASAEVEEMPSGPVNVDGAMSRAKRIRQRDPAGALRLYRKVLSKNPGHGDAMQLAARAYLQLGRTSEAIKLLLVCRTKRPRFSPCVYYLGRAYERAGRTRDARKTYQILVDKFPESSLANKARQKLGE
jgi:type IV secretory pathway VirB10-like protein